LDNQRFDGITKQFATGMSRRRVAKGLLAGGAAGMVALLGARQSKAGDCDVEVCHNLCSGAGGGCMKGCLCMVCGKGCPKRK
jgi:hypothetical protein